MARTPGLLQDLPRLLRTVRHLTPRQLLWRAWTSSRFQLYARVPAIAAVGLGGPALSRRDGLAAVAGWVARKFPDAVSEHHLRLACEALRGRFTFLNRSVDFEDGRVDWRPAGVSRLWQYHLHYGEYVAALALTARQTLEAHWAARAWALVDEWIARNPAGSRPGWEPYPLSLRVVNWTVALGALSATASAEGRVERLLGSLAAQGRFLARHLEYHLGGNHLVKNAKALVALSALLDGPEADRWRLRARALLLSELRRQVLPDGGHFERSPLYHCIVLEDVLDCLALAASAAHGTVLGEEDVGELTTIARRMARWLRVMLHPDGGLPLFNDCVVAGEPPPGAILRYAARLGPPDEAEPGPTVALPASGYYVLRSGPGRMVIDCGPVGPDELPAHAHADTLSYELTWGAERVIVDSGTAEYALDDLRRYVRSTAAHNTVVVDGAEQSEVWASHRVGRRARPLGARVSTGAGAVLFAGAHDGYAWRGVIHHRHVVGMAEVWAIVDELVGHGPHRFESFIHLHPAFRAESDADGSWFLTNGTLGFRVRPLGPVTVGLDNGWYCPDWGDVEPARVLRLRGEGSLPLSFGYVIAPADRDVRVELAADGAGITLTGATGAETIGIRSDRCTSSS